MILNNSIGQRNYSIDKKELVFIPPEENIWVIKLFKTEMKRLQKLQKQIHETDFKNHNGCEPKFYVESTWVETLRFLVRKSNDRSSKNNND